MLIFYQVLLVTTSTNNREFLLINISNVWHQNLPKCSWNVEGHGWDKHLMCRNIKNILIGLLKIGDSLLSFYIIKCFFMVDCRQVKLHLAKEDWNTKTLPEKLSGHKVLPIADMCFWTRWATYGRDTTRRCQKKMNMLLIPSVREESSRWGSDVSVGLDCSRRCGNDCLLCEIEQKISF